MRFKAQEHLYVGRKGGQGAVCCPEMRGFGLLKTVRLSCPERVSKMKTVRFEAQVHLHVGRARGQGGVCCPEVRAFSVLEARPPP